MNVRKLSKLFNRDCIATACYKSCSHRYMQMLTLLSIKQFLHNTLPTATTALKHHKCEKGHEIRNVVSTTPEDPGWGQVCLCQDPPFPSSSFPPPLLLLRLAALDPLVAV